MTDLSESALVALLTEFVARDSGYYEVPRTASVEDVAEQLGCTSSTASIHLRKGESRLITTILDR